MAPRTGGDRNEFGYRVIKSASIRNFRGFSELAITNISPINILVGDNGVGKTAVLEAIFLALGGTPELALRYRAFRGLDMTFSGPSDRIEEAVIRDLFHNGNWEKPVVVDLEGSGPASRMATINKFAGEVNLPFGSDFKELERTAPIEFSWRDAKGSTTRRRIIISPSGIQLTGIDPELPDFFLYPANHTVSSTENANRFSDLSKANKVEEFIKALTSEYKLISGLKLETQASMAMVYATIRDTKLSFPLANVSGGINRVIAFLLAIASRKQSITLIDEFENGIYYKHYEAISRTIINMARKYESQLFISTHSIEWLEAFFRAAGKNVSDISVWRLERRPDGFSELLQFSGRASAAAIRSGELR